MDSSVKKLKNCKHILEVNIPSERVKEEFDKAYESIGKFASIPGFRTGKAPRYLLESYYSKTANEEVIKKLIPETYEYIIKEHRLDPIGYPDISDVKLDLKEGFSYKASIEIRPEFTVRNYKGLKLKRKNIEVKEADVEKNLASLREFHSHNVPKKDSVEKEKILPKLDDEFAKDLGFENLEKLKEAVRQELREKLKIDAEADLEMQLINQLVDTANFEVPESIVASEKERLVRDADARMKYVEALQKKTNPDKKFSLNDEDKKELEDHAYKQAIRQVKAFFILDKISVMEKISVTRDEMDKYMEHMAVLHKKTKEEIEKILEKEHMLDEIAINIRNKKVMDFLLKEARISEDITYVVRRTT